MNPNVPPLSDPASHGVAVLAHLGVIRVQGADAAAFLHGQLTQDFALLGADRARLAAYCSPKGRVLASFVGFKRAPDDIVLVCSKDLLEATLKRLRMFVLRAKVQLSDASGETAVYGVVGGAAQPVPAAAWAHSVSGPFDVVQLYPAQDQSRQLWVGPLDAPRPPGADLPLAVWQWLEVCSGVATVSAPVVDAFVPQMLNYESVGGVNFKKGCYPGQEVVARSQFRGTLKRRAYVVQADSPMQAGEAVYGAHDSEQPVGSVVQAAPDPQGHWAAIVSIQTQAAQETLHLGQSNGPTLRHLSLPYPLLEDV